MEFLSAMWHSTWHDASISCDRAPVASPNPWQETSTNWYSHYYLHEMISWWSINTKSFTQTLEQMDTKDQNKEIYTDYWADGYKRPEQRDLHRLLSRRIQKSSTKSFARTIEQIVPKISTKSFAQTIEQMDTKNPNKELYTDNWADRSEKSEQRALHRLLDRWFQKTRTKRFTQTIEQMDTKQPKGKWAATDTRVEWQENREQERGREVAAAAAAYHVFCRLRRAIHWFPAIIAMVQEQQGDQRSAVWELPLVIPAW